MRGAIGKSYISLEHCLEKTAKQNVYKTEGQARVAAARNRLRKGDHILAFKCRFCGKWHIGCLIGKRKK